MRAVLMDRYGGPEVLRVGQVARPTPGVGEVLIRVAAVGVNPADPKWRMGMFQGFAPLGFSTRSGGTMWPVSWSRRPRGARWRRGARVAAMLDAVRQGGLRGVRGGGCGKCRAGTGRIGFRGGRGGCRRRG